MKYVMLWAGSPENISIALDSDVLCVVVICFK